MTTLLCRNLAKDCLDTLSAADSKEIQKVFLDHVHAKHQAQWSQFSRQFKAVSLVTMRDRFCAQEADDLKDGIPAIGALPIIREPGDSGSLS
jgi:hypothetical protein